MNASRQAFRFARRAANHLGQHSGVANSSVAGGMFSQNCFMSTSVGGRSMTGVQTSMLMSALEMAEVAESAEPLEMSGLEWMVANLQGTFTCLRCASGTTCALRLLEH
eukprot:TRINITY_DN303_c0_g1_i2.p4 TRINITY_DN303_c0_g1~~TRINITY_DN303_c0_g1_i2.p4  ORF type:complete len:108 (+),score=20.92 TRINITY_DN303_c0_g1_i2:63-386(+)